MKRFLSFVLVIALLLPFVPSGLFCITASAATASGNTTEFAGGSGTENDPYLISTKEHLNNVRFYPYAAFKMINDIEFTDADFSKDGAFYNNGLYWEPIDFAGFFDGNYYSITNLRICRNTSCVGLFGTTMNSVIMNVCLVDAVIEGRSNVGGIAGKATGAIIKNCYTRASIVGEENVGGIVGGGYENNNISSCVVEGSVTGLTNVGGICGYVNPYYNARVQITAIIESCSNAAEIFGADSIGGIVGYVYTTYAYKSEWVDLDYGYSGNGYFRVVWYAPQDVLIENCYNTGCVTAYEGSACGIIGNSLKKDGPYKESTGKNTHQSDLKNCYNCGKISGTTNACGIAKVGYGVTTGNSFYLESCVVKALGAGTKLTHNQMRTQNSFSEWDFDTVWTMKGTEEYLYPELQCFTLNGTVKIKGTVAYGETVSVEISSAKEIDDTYTYRWYVDGVQVSEADNYTVQANDIGKTLIVKASIAHLLLKGTLTSDGSVVGKSTQTDSPAIPNLLYLDDNKFEISTVSTQEYSIDNINWQSSGVFENLDPNKTYTVYSRILENALYLTGESVEVLQVGTDRRPLTGKVSITGTARYGDTLTADVSTLLPTGATFAYEWKIGGEVIGTGNTYTIKESDIGKNIVLYVKGTGNYIGTISSVAIVATKTTVQLPNAPVVANKTNTSVTLVEKAGYEYSLDKVKWQDSPVFTGLSAATEYTFYQRAKETSTTFASKASNGTKETTLKNTVTTPAKPAVKTITNTSVTLVPIVGYEYSMDGLTWQSSNVFTGLAPYTEYSFCQRIAENQTQYASAQSAYTIVITLKNAVSAPGAPTIEKATATSVTLAPVSGYEYSIDGKTWQSNNVFTGLTTLKTYTFYQRIKETNTDYASAISAGTAFKLKYEADSPAMPILVEKTNNKIVVEVKQGYEYSLGGQDWGTEGVYINLNPNMEYKIYCRTVESDTHYAGQSSAALVVVTLKNTAGKLSAPTVSEKTSSTVTLKVVAGAEYSKDGSTWQKSNVFSNLAPNTEYSFYQRLAETNSTYAGEKSAAVKVTTLKKTVAAPSAPTAQNITSTVITLKAVSGCEYSIDGITWQTSNTFTGLNANTAYTFYQRYAETTVSYVSEKSTALTVTTPKQTPSAPAAPVVKNATASVIVLQETEGCEYSLDGTIWQDSNVFTGLTADTEYTFYQRFKESNTSNVSATSPVLRTKTAPKSACSIKPAAPIVADYTSNKIVLVKRDGYEYKLGNGAWTTNPTFTNLQSSTTYTVYQRIAESDDEYASEASVGVKVTTDMTYTNAVTAQTNYDMLRSYINRYGTTNSDGNKWIVQSDTTSSGLKLYFYLENRSSGIEFALLTDQSSSTKIVDQTYFDLSRSSSTIYVYSSMIYYYYGSVEDAASYKTNISKSSYSASNTYSTSISGTSGYISNSDFRENFNTTLELVCTFWDSYIYSKLGFGLKGLGFASFSGNGSKVCDSGTGYHAGSITTRNARPATCVVDGYTGDSYCTNCGYKVSSGKSISCIGTHTYSSNCDKDCNNCGEERRIVHTYASACDEKCDVCNHSRDGMTDHIFSAEGVCTKCGAMDCIPGDLTGDGKINSLDGLMLLRYLNGWNINIASPEAMDVNGDGKVNSLDGLILLRYLNGWNVTLG